MSFMDLIFGFGPKKADLLHGFYEIKSLPSRQCQLALKYKNRPGAWIIVNALSPLDEIVPDSEEFRNELNPEQKMDFIRFYINNSRTRCSKNREIHGLSLDYLLHFFCMNEEYDLLISALKKGFFLQEEILLFMMKRPEFLEKAVAANVTAALDFTLPLVSGITCLHYFAEKWSHSSLLISILRGLSYEAEERIKTSMSTSSEGNSLLHSAVLSDNPELIRYVAVNYGRLCVNKNRLGMSAFRLAIATGASIQSIDVLLKHGCLVHDDLKISKPIKEAKIERFFESAALEIEKLSKWVRIGPEEKVLLTQRPSVVIGFPENYTASSKTFKFFGLLNAHSSFINLIDNNQFGDSRNSRRITLSPSLRSRSSDNYKCISRLWNILSSENFTIEDLEADQISLEAVIIGFRLYIGHHLEVKLRVLRNLAKVTKIDFSNCLLGDFMRILLQFATPEVFAFFVKNHMDYYFCIRFILATRTDFLELLPLLNAIEFDPSKPFIDGLFAVHLAAQFNNLDALKFLRRHYKVNLLSVTVYERNNILHYGLSDTVSVHMREYLLGAVPFLLKKLNIFRVSPYQLHLMQTNQFDFARRIIETLNLQIKRKAPAMDPKIIESYNEVIRIWPTGVCDTAYKNIFSSTFSECKMDEIARLLLGFASKKLMVHVCTTGTNDSIFFRQKFVVDHLVTDSSDPSPSPKAVNKFKYSP